MTVLPTSRSKVSETTWFALTLAANAEEVEWPLRSVMPGGRERVALRLVTEVVPRYSRLTIRGTPWLPGCGDTTAAVEGEPDPHVALCTWNDYCSCAMGGGMSTEVC